MGHYGLPAILGARAARPLSWWGEASLPASLSPRPTGGQGEGHHVGRAEQSPPYGGARADRLSCLAILFGLFSFLITDSGLSAEPTAPAASPAIDKPAPLQYLNLGPQSVTGNATPGQREQAIKAFDLSPAVFIENKGQWDSQVRYGFDGKGTRVSFTDAGPVFQMLKSGGEDGEVSQAVFSATFVGGRKVTPVGIEKSPSTTNYYVGKDSSKWQSSVPSFQKVAYLGLYEGVDLYTWGKRSGLKYEFHVAPGASWKQIVVRYDGIDGLSIDDKGALHVKTPLGEIIDSAPVVYQETDHQRVEIAARFSLVDKSSYRFQITGAVDPSLSLVIDPSLAWGSYLGGGRDIGSGIAVDSSGNCYVTGTTNSSDFPTPGGFDTSFNGGAGDAFVAKITTSGQLEWATYLGGNDDDYGYGIAADAAGNCYVTGYTASSDFPVPGAFDTYCGDCDGFLTKTVASQSWWKLDGKRNGVFLS